jgi:cytochrome oxidase assembly protein ShyY1
MVSGWVPHRYRGPVSDDDDSPATEVEGVAVKRKPRQSGHRRSQDTDPIDEGGLRTTTRSPADEEETRVC